MKTSTKRENTAAKAVSLKNTELSFATTAKRPAARYVSASMVCEEALDHGRWIGLYWSATGHVHRENVTTGLPNLPPLQHLLHAFELEIDGQLLHNHWDWVGASQRPGKRGNTEEAIIELRHQVRPVTVKVVTRVDSSPVLARYLEITNTGKVSAALSHISPWSGVLWNNPIRQKGFAVLTLNPGNEATSSPSYSLGYFRGEEWGQEGDFVWQPLPAENFRIERKAHGRSWGSPYYIVRNEATGEMVFLGLAWSGNFFAEFRNRPDTVLEFRLGPLAPAPLRVLAPGETVTSPEVHLGFFHGQMNACVGQWHEHMRASVIPTRPKGKEMYTIVGRVVEEPGEWILKEVDIAAEMGVEAFMVDAGWYGQSFKGWWENRGDWFEGDWLPGGLAGIRAHIHNKGMLFGLWHEAEALCKNTRTYKAHPDWFLKTDDGRECADTLDLANPEAARFFEESLFRILREYEPDFYKLDYNVRIGEGGQSVRDGFAESEFWRHGEVLYRAYDRALREHPDLCLENCAGGGGRNDLGMLSRFHYACESDWSVFPCSIRAINALSLFIPPESICYYHNHIQHAHQTTDLDTHLRVTLFALPIFVGFGAQNADRSMPYFQKAKRYIELHKGFCRPVLAGAPVVHHHTPDIGLFQPAEWCVLEYACPDRSRGYVGVFKLTGGRSEYRFRPRGVDGSATYRVMLDNRRQVLRLSGQDLLLRGIPVELDAALTSELIMYEKV